MGTAIIAGLGPGFGEELARQLAAEGHELVFFARSEAYIEDFADELREEDHKAIGVAVDITEPDQVEAGFERARDAFGPVDVLTVLASDESGWKTLAGLSADEFRHAWELYGFGTFLCAKEAAADMRASGDGTILVVGVTERYGKGEGHGYVSATAAKRALTESLARELAPEVHVVHVGIDGAILNPDNKAAFEPDIEPERFIDPGSAAAVCAELVGQDRGAWTTSVDLRAPRDELDAILEELLG